MPTEPDTSRADLIEALGAVAFAVMAALSRVAAEHDLSLTQLRMIGILRDRRMTITELAHALGLDRSSVSGLVERTETRGLVQREPNPDDARSVHVTLSPRGAEALSLGATEAAGLLSSLTDALTLTESRRLTALLDRMIEHRGL
ncbi:MAG: MarR family transcriptional regulator [Acidimicrobiales bacterium]